MGIGFALEARLNDSKLNSLFWSITCLVNTQGFLSIQYPHKSNVTCSVEFDLRFGWVKQFVLVGPFIKNDPTKFVISIKSLSFTQNKL